MESFERLGKINVIRESSLMPVIDIRIHDFSRIESLGIFSTAKSKSKDTWDVIYEFDIEKLNKYISIIVNINNKSKG